MHKIRSFWTLIILIILVLLGKKFIIKNKQRPLQHISKASSQVSPPETARNVDVSRLAGDGGELCAVPGEKTGEGGKRVEGG